MNWFQYNIGLRHERVKTFTSIAKQRVLWLRANFSVFDSSRLSGSKITTNNMFNDKVIGYLPLLPINENKPVLFII